jgi:hypothetical protein
MSASDPQRTYLEAASSICLSSEAVVRTYGHEINVQALAPTTILSQAAAPEIFEIYPPAPFPWCIGGKVVLGDRRSLADAGDVLPDFRREVGDVMGIQRIVFASYATAFGSGRGFAQEQGAKRHNQGPHHSTLQLGA